METKVLDGATIVNETFYVIVVILCSLKTWYDIQMLCGLVLVVHVIKTVVQEERPDGRDKLSFPSGHAAVAVFLAARFDWNPVVVLWAISVCMARVQKKRHFVHDVLAGAVCGGVAHAIMQL